MTAQRLTCTNCGQVCNLNAEDLCGECYKFPINLKALSINIQKNPNNNKMTDEQERHLQMIKDRANELIDKKYRAGQAVHGGNLFDKTRDELIEEIINEAIDSLVYSITAKNKPQA